MIDCKINTSDHAQSGRLTCDRANLGHTPRQIIHHFFYRLQISPLKTPLTPTNQTQMTWFPQQHLRNKRSIRLVMCALNYQNATHTNRSSNKHVTVSNLLSSSGDLFEHHRHREIDIMGTNLHRDVLQVRYCTYDCGIDCNRNRFAKYIEWSYKNVSFMF